jgi:hypothetical protein
MSFNLGWSTEVSLDEFCPTSILSAKFNSNWSEVKSDRDFNPERVDKMHWKQIVAKSTQEDCYSDNFNTLKTTRYAQNVIMEHFIHPRRRLHTKMKSIGIIMREPFVLLWQAIIISYSQDIGQWIYEEALMLYLGIYICLWEYMARWIYPMIFCENSHQLASLT